MKSEETNEMVLVRLTHLNKVITDCENTLKSLRYYDGTPYAASEDERREVLQKLSDAENERGYFESSLQKITTKK